MVRYSTCKISVSIVISVVVHGLLLARLDLDMTTEISYNRPEQQTIKVNLVADASPSLPSHVKVEPDLASEAITEEATIDVLPSKAPPESANLINAIVSTRTTAMPEAEKQKAVIQEKAEQRHVRSTTAVEVTKTSDEKTKIQLPLTIASTSTAKMNPSLLETKEAKRAKENYLASLRAAINRNKYYPARARRMRKEGEVWLEFFVYRDGRIGQLGIRKSSGESMLDRAAKQSVLKLGRYRPFPEYMNIALLSVVVPMRYTTQ